MIPFLFWLFITIFLYTYIGYPLLLMLLARYRQRVWKQAAITPTVTLVIPAYNEGAYIAAKLENSVALDYPQDKIKIVVVSSGSTDETIAVATEYVDRFPTSHIRIHNRPERRGKVTAINWITPKLDSEIIIYTDANAMLNSNSIHALVRNFADADVGCVSGRKQVHGGGEGLYWRYETKLKQLDSAVGSVMGAAGELFAIRHTIFQPIPADSLIEDFVMTMNIVLRGHRVIYEPEAIASEDDLLSLQGDWERRAHISAGCFQTLFRMPELLNPRVHKTAWQYFSHKVLRWVTPFLLPAVLILNGFLITSPFYAALFAIQLFIYVLSVGGWLRVRQEKTGGVLHATFFFFFTNAAIIAGFLRFIRGQQSVKWKKVR